MGGIYRYGKVVTATIPSGSTTASGVTMQGYALAGLVVPVITSALLRFTHDGIPISDALGANFSALTPGGTGGVAVDSDSLSFLAGLHGPLHLSAAAAQGADRTFVWQFKG